jgi:hypothetical protein
VQALKVDSDFAVVAPDRAVVEVSLVAAWTDEATCVAVAVFRCDVGRRGWS